MKIEMAGAGCAGLSNRERLARHNEVACLDIVAGKAAMRNRKELLAEDAGMQNFLNERSPFSRASLYGQVTDAATIRVHHASLSARNQSALVYAGLRQRVAIKQDIPGLLNNCAAADATKSFANICRAMSVAHFNELDVPAVSAPMAPILGTLARRDRLVPTHVCEANQEAGLCGGTPPTATPGRLHGE